MVTNYPRAVPQQEGLAPAGHAHTADGIGARVLERARQLICGLHGHDTLLQFEPDRMFLRCVSCGHETPGWALAEEPPAVTVREEPRTALVRPHLVGARRIA